RGGTAVRQIGPRAHWRRHRGSQRCGLDSQAASEYAPQPTKEARPSLARGARASGGGPPIRGLNFLLPIRSASGRHAVAYSAAVAAWQIEQRRFTSAPPNAGSLVASASWYRAALASRSAVRRSSSTL